MNACLTHNQQYPRDGFCVYCGPSAAMSKPLTPYLEASMRQTPRARRAVELAWAEAQGLNHNYVGTEHLLLGLLREGEGIAAGVLESLGIDRAKARSAVGFIIGKGNQAT